jgi:hypothetical protein
MLAAKTSFIAVNIALFSLYSIRRSRFVLKCLFLFSMDGVYRTAAMVSYTQVVNSRGMVLSGIVFMPESSLLEKAHGC